MAHLDPSEAFEHLRSRVLEGIQSHFPGGVLPGRLQSLHLDKLEVKDDLDPDDLRSQHQAKLDRTSWSVPVYAHLTLKDNASGKVVDSRKIRVAEIPKMTSRYSYIVGGRDGSIEHQVDNQWQLKPGVYTRRRKNGELESRINVQGKSSFDVVLDPEKKIFVIDGYGASSSKIPIYPILKTLGVSDEQLEKSWGKSILEANKSARGAATALDHFYKITKRAEAPSKEAAAEHLFNTLGASKVRPDATAVTLGKPFESVTGELLHLATEKMLKVQSGHPEDDRDSLIFKDLRTTGDFAFDMLRAASPTVRSRTSRQIDRATNVRNIIPFDLFNGPIQDVFHKNAAARSASQINPVEMIASASQTTVMGPGGIQNERSVTDEAKFVNPSHFGFLDPIHTPEGEKTGVSLRLPIGVKKVGVEPRIPLYNIKTGKTEDVGPKAFMENHVVLPDQVKWSNGKPSPLGSTVKMSGTGNKIVDGKFGDATYVMPYSSQLFNLTSNLIPFLGNTSGNRAGMAGRHLEQAISLAHRDQPLVQVSTGTTVKGAGTFEELIGGQTSHRAPVGGKVVEVKKDGIVIQSQDGQKHEVQIYNNFPLNEPKAVLHATPLVKVGDTVKPGSVVADTNFSKNGVLALGTNLRVAYIPYKGYNFEDGIVISKSAADKLASEHLHKESFRAENGITVDKKHFQTFHPGFYTKDQYEKLGDDGVVRIGQKVTPGDPLIVATKPAQIRDRSGLSAIRRSMSGAHSDKSVRWESDFQGEVVGVHKKGDRILVHVKTIEPMQIGDKMAGRYGNKGIVTKILEDHEMPHTSDGKHIEVALNPSGVPGRMNIGQVLETAAGKIAQKTGKVYSVENFAPGVDQLAKVKQELKDHGLSDTEHLFDPITQQPLGQALVGPQHMVKLVHQVEKKVSVRSGMQSPGGTTVEYYDQHLQPGSGSGTGGQSMGALGMYAMLAHGAKTNIREMHTWKSEGPSSVSLDPSSKFWKGSQHNAVWAAIQTGTPLPTPQPTFAFQKFTDMLKAAGVNMEKKGHQFVLSPLTDAHIKELAPNVLTRPAEKLEARVTKSGDFKPRAGGLFDERLTGGHQGKKWTRIELAEPLPNPVFASAIQRITGLSKKDYHDIIGGTKAVTSAGHLTDVGSGMTGGEAIHHLLSKIDVKKELESTKKELNQAKGAAVDKLFKKVKYLQALDHLGMKPSDAYVLHNLPVIPPVMRPVSQLPDGNVNYADLNGLYSSFAAINDKLKDDFHKKHVTDQDPIKQQLRRDYYDGVKALMGVGVPYEDQKEKGILHQIAGPNPKSGFFQETLMNRRQDLTMRSTIIPEPAIGLDEVGLPRGPALELFKPFVAKKLADMGVVRTALEAPAYIDKKGPAVWRALEKVMEERPVLMKRDPALHKYSVQGFKSRMVPGNAIQIHPLVTGGYNADFDGDTMSVFVPISHDAVDEVRKMMPSNNLFAEATGKIMYQPTLESALGLYKLSMTGADSKKTFTHPGAAVEAVRTGALKATDVITLNGKKTTAGRILLASAVPEPMQKDLLHNLDKPIDRGGLNNLLTTLGKNHKDEFGTVINKLKDMGNEAAFGAVKLPTLPSGHQFKFEQINGYNALSTDPSKAVYIPVGTHSLSLQDFTPDTATREKLLGVARSKVESIHRDGKLSASEKERLSILEWEKAADAMKDAHLQEAKKNPSNLLLMLQAGVKPSWDQYKQMVLAPMLFEDSAKKTIPHPVTKSYAEGLDLTGYWHQMPGARRGTVMKVQEVRGPGFLSKMMMSNTLNMVVNAHDCGTKNGVALPVADQDLDLHDRYLAQDVSIGKLHAKAGEVLTPDLLSKIRAAKKDAKILVRSPLKCEEEKGLCQKCTGLSAQGHDHPFGTNVGVLSAQALGERAVQLALKEFHTGGVKESGAKGGTKLLTSFNRLEQLMNLDAPANSASIALASGKITKIDREPTGVNIWVNNTKHFVGKDESGAHLHEPLKGIPHLGWEPPKVGMHVEAGQFLSDPSRTVLNPHDLFAATKSIEQVQNHLANEVHNLYKKEGVRRRAVEVVVKSMSNLTKVHDPGDATVLRGEFRPLSSVRKMNAELLSQGKTPVTHEPVIKGVNMMPLAVQEDWMAKLQHDHLRDTILDAAAKGGTSNIHGLHPIPGMAFGAEFGLTSHDSKKLGLEHLHDVKAHHY